MQSVILEEHAGECLYIFFAISVTRAGFRPALAVQMKADFY